MIDTSELKRMMTNADGDHKIFIGNIIRGIHALENENRLLKIDNAKLVKQLGESSETTEA